MANKLYQEQMSNNPMNQFGQFKNDPISFLANKGLNVPPQYANDPRGAVQYLIQNGQMNQNALANFMQKVQMMGFRF